MIFGWLKRRRRRRLREEPLPKAWDQFIAKNVRQDAWLSPSERAKLRDMSKVFVAEKHWVGCGGLEITDEVKVTIAAQACLLLLGVEDFYFDRVETILVYPGTFLPPSDRPTGGDLFGDERPTLGEAWHRGPVILSWKHVLPNRDRPRRSVVIHEFAHQLDGLDGEIGGTPPLSGLDQHRRWNEVAMAEYHRLESDVRRGEATWLDPYGATNPAEFFAVVSEHFFEEARELRQHYPDLYEVLSEFYRQDPVNWNYPTSRWTDRP